MLTETATCLNAATVTEIAGDRVRLQLPDRAAWARLALASPYSPIPGDVVLAIGEEELYVIGVLAGRGKTCFDVSGDLELRASGRVRISGGDAIELRSPRVVVKADCMEMFVRKAVEKFVDVYRWVRGLSQTRAGRVRTVVDDQYTLSAERIFERAEKDVKLDGERIRLG